MSNGKLFLLILFLFLNIFPSGKDRDEKAYYFYYKGKFARQDGNMKLAASNYLKAVKIEPGNNQYIQALIQTYLEDRQLDKAENTLEKYQACFSASQDLFIFYFLQGLVYACKGDHAQAFGKFSIAERLCRKMNEKDSIIVSHLYNNLACERILNQAVEWTPGLEESPHITISPGILPKARVHCLQALQFNPENKVALRNLELIEAYCNCEEVKNNSLNDNTMNSLPAASSNLNNRAQNSSTPAPLYNIRFLPKRMAEIVRILNKYDEIVLLMDISGSMEERVKINDLDASRFEIMIDMARYLISGLDSTVSLGALTVGVDCDSVPRILCRTTYGKRRDLALRIESLHPEGYTPLNGRLAYCQYLFSDTARHKAILMFSDGLNTCGDGSTCEIAESLFARGINIYILSFLLEQESQLEYSVFDCMANISEGEIFEVETNKGITKKTLDTDPPYYSLVLPTDMIDTSFCLNYERLKCDWPCIPGMEMSGGEKY